MMRRRPIVLIAFLCALLTACGVIKPYHVTVQQGNLLNKDAIAQLKSGMNKDQVRALLGTPVLDNAFDEDCWIYVYTLQKGGKKMEEQRLAVLFKNGRLVRQADDCGKN